MTTNNILKLVIAIGVSLSAGAIGSLFTATPKSLVWGFTASAVPEWYVGLIKPALNPPSWVFGPVWTILYLLMGISLFLIWKQHSNILENVRMLRIWRIGVAAFFVQLALNALWSIIFFGLHNPGGALIEIVFLWLAILATIIAFAKISPPAGGLAAWLLVPYILWVSFAGYLNFSIWMLN